MVCAVNIGNIKPNQPNRLQANYEIVCVFFCAYDSVLSLVRTHKLFRFCMLQNDV